MQNACSWRTGARSRCGSSAPAGHEGIATVAVVAPDDRGSLHARSADETVEIASYLDAAEHVRAAAESGADAVHPGYGFLAESAELAEAVLAAGLTWIGPPPAALRARRRQARREGDGARAPACRCCRAARRRRSATRCSSRPPQAAAAAACGSCATPEELDDAVAAAQREAAGAFGDDTVFFERYLERPRHVEIQLLADTHGTVRRARRARVLDPAPAPEGARGVAVGGARPRAARAHERRRRRVRARDRLRERGHRRVRARRARLLLPRAERAHPGRASGDRARHGRRPRARAAAHRARREACNRRAACSGTRSRCGSTPRTRARSCRRPGRIERLRLPAGIRVDAGVEEGDEIGTSYDPMIAKLIALRADARRGVRPARRRAARDRGRRRHDEPAVPALARRAPARARGPHDDGVPHREPAALRAAAARAGPGRGAAPGG